MFVGAVAAVVWGGWLSTNGWSDLASALASDGALCALALVGAVLTAPADALSAFPLRTSITEVLVGLAVGAGCLVVSAGYVAVLALLVGGSPEAAESNDSPTATIATWVTVVFAAPLAEELLCRGALWRALERLHPGRTAETLIATAGLFAVLHGLNGGFLAEFPHRFAAGLGFGWLRARSGSMSPSIVAHALHNALAILWSA